MQIALSLWVSLPSVPLHIFWTAGIVCNLCDKVNTKNLQGQKWSFPRKTLEHSSRTFNKYKIWYKQSSDIIQTIFIGNDKPFCEIELRKLVVQLNSNSKCHFHYNAFEPTHYLIIDIIFLCALNFFNNGDRKFAVLSE